MDILGIPADGFDYDFDSSILRLSDTSGTVIREIPIDDQGRMFVNYYGRFKTFYYLPYMYCFDPEMLDPTYWDGKVALVGASLPGLMDLRNTPVQETFAGVEIHANTMHSILQNEFVRTTSAQKNFNTILILSIFLGIIVSVPKKPLYTIPVPLLAILAWYLYSYNQFFNSLVMWEIIRPSLSLGGTYLGVFLYNFLVAEKDKRFLKDTFSTYISPELIDQMFDAKEEPQLGGEEGYHTAFFTDIQSFSAFSEKLTATDLVELLNDYLTEMTDTLLENKGTLDKYIGDAIVAFYGAPAPVDDHEYHACLTAVLMQERLSKMRDKWRDEGDRWPEIVHNMQNRIGINTGKMVTGNMGSTMRMNYTMMGDTVNLAARLESSAKQYGIYIQVANETYTPCKDKFTWRDLDFVRVMGKTEPAQVYELIAVAGKETEQDKTILKAYHEALELYRSQDWDKAKNAFKAADELEDMFPGRKTNPSRVYMPRCDHWKANPPGDDWDGIWTLTSK
jgi:adenylate cyclase